MSAADQAVESFIERMGLSAEADGLPRIAGRILGFFVIHGGPCSLSELAETLRVSRGSISTNARLLSGLGVIERVSRPGDRQDYYRLAPQPYARMLDGYIERIRGIERNVQEAQEQLPSDWRGARERLAEMGRFYCSAREATEGLVERLRRHTDEDE